MTSPGLAWRDGGSAPASRRANSRRPPVDPFWRDAGAALAMAAGWAAWGLLLLLVAGCGSDRITRAAVTLKLLDGGTVRCEGGVTITMGFSKAQHQCHGKTGYVWAEVDSGFVKGIDYEK